MDLLHREGHSVAVCRETAREAPFGNEDAAQWPRTECVGSLSSHVGVAIPSLMEEPLGPLPQFSEGS